MPFLEYQSDDEPTFAVLTQGLIVGRDEGAGLQLPDRSCSREHFQLERRQGQWAVLDLGSANGTKVNGQLVQRVSLSDGDVIQCGDTQLVYRRTRPLLGSPEDDVGSTDVSEAPSLRRSTSRTPALLILLVVGLSGLLYWSLADKPVPQAKGRPVATAEVETEGKRSSDPVVDSGDALSADEHAELDARRAFRAEVEVAREGAFASADQGEWAAAIDVVDTIVLRAAATGRRGSSVRARRLRIDILKRLHADWDKSKRPFRETLASGDIEGARGLLHDLGRRFESTPILGRLDGEEALLELKVFLMARAPTVAKAATDSEIKEPLGTSQSAVTEIDSLWLSATEAASRADWTTASALAERALAVGEAPAGLSARARLYRAHENLRAAVIAALKPGGHGIARFSIGRVFVTPESADDSGVDVGVGEKGQMRWKWSDLGSEHRIRLYRSVARTAPLRVDAAVVMASQGLMKQATALMVRAVRDASVKSDADRIVAFWRGIAVPNGGFVVDGKRFLTPAEKEVEDLVRRATRLAKGLKRARLSKYREIVSELQAMGKAAEPVLTEALKLRVTALFEATRKVGSLGKMSATRQALAARLKLLRTEAMALIFDTKRYPYPYGPNQDKVQTEVDELTGKVKALYNHPGRYLFEQDKTLNAHIEFWAEAADDLALLTRQAPDTSALFAMIDELVDMPQFADSPKHVQKNAEVLQYNLDIDTTAKAEEREVVRLTNVYRMTMGLRAVKIAEPLILAARGHSTEMQKLKYFSHTSPVKGRTSPSDRARLAGWGGGVSENIARGSSSAQGSVNQWIHSSGHHRNILGRGWGNLGVGLSPQNWYWTQNFGR